MAVWIEVNVFSSRLKRWVTDVNQRFNLCGIKLILKMWKCHSSTLFWSCRVLRFTLFFLSLARQIWKLANLIQKSVLLTVYYLCTYLVTRYTDVTFTLLNNCVPHSHWSSVVLHHMPCARYGCYKSSCLQLFIIYIYW